MKAIYSKSEIDGLFAKWGVKDVYWRWDPEHNDVFVQFKIEEEIDGAPLQVSAKIEAPSIWDHKTRSKGNVGSNTANGVKLHVVAMRSTVVVIDTYVMIGNINGEQWTTISGADLTYTGNALSSWTITPEYT